MNMTKNTMRKLVCKYVYRIEYNPDTFRKTDWKEIMHQLKNEPSIKQVRLLNENKVNFVRQEYILLEQTRANLEEMMFHLETKHEKWLVDNNGVFRYKDYKSIEGKPMMEGPEGISIEEWLGYFYNNIIEYKSYMEKELGIAIKGDVGEENVVNILAESRYADYVAHNVVLNVSDEGGNTNEIDTFVILPYGVAVLEVKNYGKRGQTLSITDNDMWNLYDRRKIKKVKNPAYQNSRHTRATRLILRNLLGRDIPIFPLIVIGNNQVRIERHSNLTVKNIDELITYLNSLRSNEHLSDQERKQIKKFLENEDIGANAFSVVSYREQINYIKAVAKEVYIAASFNQDAKVLYYKIQDVVSYGFVGVIALILVAGGLLTHNFDSFMILLLVLCITIVTVAGTVHLAGKLKGIFGDK